MDLKQIRDSIMTADEVNHLYELEIDLVEFVGILHERVSMAESRMEQSEAKSELSMANTLLAICRDKQSEVKDVGAKLNYNFRMAAKKMLKAESYKQIFEASFVPRREFKKDKTFHTKNLS